jgi:methionyl-tRNA formyltransferase
MRAVFMGTPDFAVPSLRILAEHHTVAGVFSQPDRPNGRGHRLTPPPVKLLAESLGIPVFQPETLKGLKGEAALASLAALKPDIVVVAAYGRILPEAFLRLPKFGCINVHASLLPRLRGAAPIQWSVINGDSLTGVTIMSMAKGLDTGDIISQAKAPIEPEATAGDMFVKLSELGARLLAETLTEIEAGRAVRTPQNHAEATYAPMLDKNIAAISFNTEAVRLCNLIRGLYPAPCAYTLFEGKRLKLCAARPAEGYFGEPGTVLDPKRLIVACKDGAVELLTVAAEGKRPVTGAEFARGKRLSGGEVFGSI